MRVVIFILFVTLSKTSFSQFNRQKRNIPIDTVTVTAAKTPDYSPVYPGGFEAMMNFIRKKMKMPSSAKKNKVDGKVYVRFLVKEDGEVANIEVMTSLHPDCDAEAIRIIKLMPKWKPREGSDKIVPTIFMVPIQFKVH